MSKLSAYYRGKPGEAHEDEIRHQMEHFGGKSVGSGYTFDTGVRDIEYEFNNELKAGRCARVLSALGYGTGASGDGK